MAIAVDPARARSARAATSAAASASTGSMRVARDARRRCSPSRVLVIVVSRSPTQGASAISLDFFTKAPPTRSARPGGGIATAIVGSAPDRRVRDRVRAAARRPDRDLPQRVRRGRGPRTRSGSRSTCSTACPSIVIGVFVYGLLVLGHGQSGLAGVVRARDHHAAADRARRRRRCCGSCPSSLREAASRSA